MLAKCANPACSKPFHYLREGKVFRFDATGLAHGARPQLVHKKPPPRVEYFWLCGPCSVQMTMTYHPQQGVVAAALHPAAARAAAS